MVVVLIVGILAAVAITLYLRNTDDAHNVEAVTNLEVLGKGAQVYFQEAHKLDPEKPAIAGSYPPNTQCTSTGNQHGAAQTPDAADFAITTTFYALRWSLTKPHRYKFCYIPDPPQELFVKGFTLYAVASLRGDSDSVMVVRGDVNAEGQPQISGARPGSLDDMTAAPSGGSAPDQVANVEAAIPGEPSSPEMAAEGAAAAPIGAKQAAQSPTEPTSQPPSSQSLPSGAGEPANPINTQNQDPTKTSADDEPTTEYIEPLGNTGAGNSQRSYGGGSGSAPPPPPDQPSRGDGCSVQSLRR